MFRNILKSPYWPWAFVFTVVMILITECFHQKYDDYFYTTETKTTQATVTGLDGFRMKIKNELSLKKDQRFDVIILGDSYYISGLIPKLIEERKAYRVFNFASFGDHGVFASYLFLKNHLKNNPPPRYLILGFQPDTLSRRKINPTFMYEFKKGNSKEMLSEFGWKEAVKMQIPSLKHQALLQQILKNYKFPNIISAKDIKELRREVIADKGYYAPYAWQAVAEPVRDEDYNKKFRFRPSETSKRNLNNILRLAEKNNIQVIYLVPTFSEDWYVLYKKYGILDAYAEFVNKLQSEFPKITVWNFQSQILDFKLYADRLHLNINGSERLSNLVAAALP